jgi:hypothetical protein
MLAGVTIGDMVSARIDELEHEQRATYITHG